MPVDKGLLYDKSRVGPACVCSDIGAEKSSGSRLILSDGCLRVFWQGRAALTFLPFASWQLIIHMQNGGIHGASPSLHGGAHRFPEASPSKTSPSFEEGPPFTRIINTRLLCHLWDFPESRCFCDRNEAGNLVTEFFYWNLFILTVIITLILGKEGHVNKPCLSVVSQFYPA